MSKVLHLNLHRRWFDLIAVGAKTIEYRWASHYWLKRLRGREFDVIHFRNGYTLDRPFMIVECQGIYLSNSGFFEIALGKILEINNWDGQV